MFNDILVNTTEFASGTYVVNIIEGQQIISKKVIKL